MIPIFTLNQDYEFSDIYNLLTAGVNCIRLNPARIGFPKTEQLLQVIRQIKKETDIFIDTPGNKARLHISGAVQKQKNEQLIIAFDNGTKAEAYIPKYFFRELQSGDALIVRSKIPITMKVLEKYDSHLLCSVINAFDSIKNNTHVFLKNRCIVNSQINDEDFDVLKFVNENKIGFVALSFSDTVEMLQEAKNAITNNSTKILAKIESRVGVLNMRDILNECDGIIIGRDDLSTVMSNDEIHKVVEQAVNLCRLQNKICIPASNYFLGLTVSDCLTSDEYAELKSLNNIHDGYIYCNESVLSSSLEIIKKIRRVIDQIGGQ